MNAFIEWFCQNYPNGCVITHAAWHAPKIYRAAVRFADMEAVALRPPKPAEREQPAAFGGTSDEGEGAESEEEL